MWHFLCVVLHESSNNGLIMEKLVRYLEEDDFQSFPNEQIWKSRFLDTVCPIRSFENADEGND